MITKVDDHLITVVRLPGRDDPVLPPRRQGHASPTSAAASTHTVQRHARLRRGHPELLSSGSGVARRREAASGPGPPPGPVNVPRRSRTHNVSTSRELDVLVPRCDRAIAWTIGGAHHRLLTLVRRRSDSMGPAHAYRHGHVRRPCGHGPRRRCPWPWALGVPHWTAARRVTPTATHGRRRSPAPSPSRRPGSHVRASDSISGRLGRCGRPTGLAHSGRSIDGQRRRSSTSGPPGPTPTSAASTSGSWPHPPRAEGHAE